MSLSSLSIFSIFLGYSAFILSYICPLCASPLTPNSTTWACQQGHGFDVARQGYVNLLPVQHKKSKIPGDAPEMVDARRQFLQQGFYAPLKQALMDVFVDAAVVHLVDVGCGEGYYTQALANCAKQTTAIDISKSAASLCARYLQVKQHTDRKVLVASSSQLPLASGSASHISSIFAPIVPDEFARILRPNGRLLIAKPDAGHLLALRELLFSRVNTHDSHKFLDQLTPHFHLLNTRQVQANLMLANPHIKNLLDMTPYAYRAKPEKRAYVAGLQQLKVVGRFIVFELEKRS